MYEKKNILMLNYEYPPLGGGASSVASQIAAGYERLGHSVDVVTMGFKGLPGFEKKDGINIYRVKCLRKKKEICYPWEQLTYVLSAKRFLRKFLKENKYHFCHTHFMLPTGLVGLWLRKRYDIPYLITSHGSDVPGHNPDRFLFLHKFTGKMLRKICDNASAITVPSNYLKDLIHANIGDYDVTVIPNGSEDLFVPGTEKENIVLSSGRLHKSKGFHFLIKAFKALAPCDWKLYIAGDGPYREELESLAGGSPGIIFTGWLDNRGGEYLEILNRAKVFCLLSQAESQGIAYLEAMSAGCAVIASDIPACRETVSDAGFLIRRDDIEGVSGKLRLLMDDEGILREYMRRARERYETCYTWDKVISEYDVIAGPFTQVP